MTTKPPRQRPTNTPTTSRTAPTYKRLNPDTYANLTPLEQRRHDLHLDNDTNIDATPYAELDQRSIGYPTTTNGSDTTRTTTNHENLNSVEAAATNPNLNTATNWLAEATETRALITRVANLARYHYGYDPEHGRPETNRPASRQTTTKPCAWCGDPAPTGIRDTNGQLTVRVIDQLPVHRNPCYQTAATQARRTGTSLVATLTQNAKNLKNR